MKVMLLFSLILLTIFLSYKLYSKNIANKLAQKKELEKDLEKPKFNSDGERLVTKDKYVQLLRQNLIDLNNKIEDIIEKDADDEVWRSNILKALKLLDVEDVEQISDEYILEMRNLVSDIEKYYNLG